MPETPPTLPILRRVLAALTVLVLATSAAAEPLTEEDYDRKARQVVPRDKFPVLFDPKMASVAEADEALADDELVIGVTVGGASRAYPVQVMGVHELVNDTCGKVPIAASW